MRASPTLLAILSLGLATAAPAPAQQAVSEDSLLTLVRVANGNFDDPTPARMQQSLEIYRLLLPYLKEFPPPAQGAFLFNIGKAHALLLQFDSALAWFDRAEAGLAQLNRPDYTQLFHSTRGRVRLMLARWDDAWQDLTAARRLALELRKPQELGWADWGLARVHDARGEPELAIAARREEANAWSAAGEAELEAKATISIGSTYLQLGRIDSATVTLARGLAAARRARSPVALSQAFSELGTLHRRLGSVDSARAYYRLAFQATPQSGGGAGSVLRNLAGLARDDGHLDSAVVFYRAALEAFAGPESQVEAFGTRIELARTLGLLGRTDTAAVILRQLIRESERLPDPRMGYTLHYVAAQIWLGARQYDSAIPPLERARELAGRSGNRDDITRLQVLLGDIFRLSGRHARAIAQYDTAAQQLDAMAATGLTDANRTSFAENSRILTELLVLGWLGRAGEVGAGRAATEALGAAERGRARALLALMRAGGTAARRTPADPALSYLVTSDTLVILLSRPGMAPVVSRRAIARDTLASLVRQARAGMGVDEAAGASVLASRTISLEPQPLRAAGVAAAAGGGTAGAMGRLATLLLPDSLLRRLGPGTELVIVPHGALALVPFAALPLGGADSTLADRHALRYAPSLATLAEVTARPGLASGAARGSALKAALVVGNPAMPTVLVPGGERLALSPLPGAETEAAAVARQLGLPAPLTGEGASESVVRQRLGQAPVVHLATHGYAYAAEARSRASFVALAADPGHDGLLTVGEVADDPALALSADLVVLSACQTGLGTLKEAEGTIGLQRAFLARGARSVLVSLWSVSDDATALLMERFYTHWLSPEAPGKGEALRRAQRDVRGDARFREPRFWAAFQVVGAS